MTITIKVKDLDLQNDDFAQSVSCFCADDDGRGNQRCGYCGGSGFARSLRPSYERSVSNESFSIVATICELARFGHCVDLTLWDAPHGELGAKEIDWAHAALVRFINVAHSRASFVRPNVELPSEYRRATVIDFSTGEKVDVSDETAKCYEMGYSDERLVRLAKDLVTLLANARCLDKSVEFY